jgi:hypothetical protein
VLSVADPFKDNIGPSPPEQLQSTVKAEELREELMAFLAGLEA